MAFLPASAAGKWESLLLPPKARAMLLPFLICIVILYIPLPMGGPAVPWFIVGAGVTALALLNAFAGWVGSGLAIRLAAAPGERGTLAAARVFSFLKGGVIGFVLADVFALRWPVLLGEVLGPHAWAVFVYDVLLLLPALAMILTVMAFQHRYEFRRGRVSLPLARYVWLRFRVELAIVLVPWCLLVLATGAVSFLFGDSEFARAADTAATVAVLTVIIVFSPLLLRAIWSTSPLPAGPLRERLEAFCQANRFRCNDILVWHTHKHLANAGVVGPTPVLRYVLLTDALLRNCEDEEVEAIFAHEMGHVHHHHLGFYILFGVAFLCFYANVVDLVALTGWVAPLSSILAFDLSPGQAAVMLAFALLYWVILFGWISRRMELQADLFGLRAVAEPEVLLVALSKLGAMSSLPRILSSWRHFSIERRLAFLQHALQIPPLAARFRGRVRAVKLAVIGLLAVGTLRLLIARPELFGM
ncbi:MAG: M48 family metallopeptidase [Planctomycetota bacterium]|jgi:STE24 endopeptidase